MSKIQIESNSQLNKLNRYYYTSCIYHVKDTNRKQFTTAFSFIRTFATLYLSCQRYKSKAIHNEYSTLYVSYFAVFIMSKIQIESNSQQLKQINLKKQSCIYHVKDTNRKQFTTNAL